MTTAPCDLLRAALADRYRIERELGQGGMATVYLAHDLRHERKVGIKFSGQSRPPTSPLPWPPVQSTGLESAMSVANITEI